MGVIKSITPINTLMIGTKKSTQTTNSKLVYTTYNRKVRSWLFLKRCLQGCLIRVNITATKISLSTSIKGVLLDIMTKAIPVRRYLKLRYLRWLKKKKKPFMVSRVWQQFSHQLIQTWRCNQSLWLLDSLWLFQTLFWHLLLLLNLDSLMNQMKHLFASSDAGPF